MAQQVTITLTDDLNGAKADETLRFGVEGVEYEIDLTTANAAKFRSAVATYVEKSRRVGRSTGKAGKRTTVGPDAKVVRAWAESKKIDIPARGRIPSNILEQYAKENV